jgi:hypothetical protein
LAGDHVIPCIVLFDEQINNSGIHGKRILMAKIACYKNSL